MSQTRTQNARTRTTTSPNQSIIDMLEGKKSEPFMGTNFERIITRAIRSIRALQNPITTKEDALAIRGVGEYLATAIETHLANQPASAPSASQVVSGAAVLSGSDEDVQPPPRPRASRGGGRPRARAARAGSTSSHANAPSAQRVVSGATILPDSDDDDVQPAVSARPARGRGRSRARAARTGSTACNPNRPYMPRYRSVPYAVLITLLLGQESGKLSMKKNELALAAQQYADEAVLVSGTAEQGTWYDGWSSVNKTLIAKGLVAKGGNPARYGLSAEGRVLAEKLLEQNRQAQERTMNQYGQIPPAICGQTGQAANSGASTAAARVAAAEQDERENVQTLDESRVAQVADAVRPAERTVSAPKRARAGKSTGGRLSKVQVDRSVRVIARLESEFGRESCLSVLRDLYDREKFPKSDDGLYEAMINILWERERAGREMDARSSTIQFANPSQAIDLDSPEREVVDSSIAKRDVPRDRGFLCPHCGQHFSELIGAVHRMHCVSKQAPVSQKKCSDEVIAISDDDDEICIIPDSRPGTAEKAKVQAESPLRLKRKPGVGAGLWSSLDRSSDEDFELGPFPPLPRKTGSQPIRPSTRRSENSIDVDNDISLDIYSPDVVTADDEITIAPKSGVPLRKDLVSGGASSSGLGKQCEIVFILDSMERLRSSNSMKGPVDSIAELMRQEGVICETRSLPCGDGVFIARYDDGSEVVLDYIMERKTLNDYVSSMKDGRVARQSYMLQKSKIARRMFVLEGDMKSIALDGNRGVLLKKLAELEINEGFYVKHTKDLLDTVWFYSSLYKRLVVEFEKVVKAKAVEKRCTFSEWNDRMKGMKGSLRLEQLFMLQLCEAKGIGMGKARKVVSGGYTTPQSLFRAFDGDGSEELLSKGNCNIGSASSRMLCQLYRLEAYETRLRGDESDR